MSIRSWKQQLDIQHQFDIRYWSSHQRERAEQGGDGWSRPGSDASIASRSNQNGESIETRKGHGLGDEDESNESGGETTIHVSPSAIWIVCQTGTGSASSTVSQGGNLEASTGSATGPGQDVLHLYS